MKDNEINNTFKLSLYQEDVLLCEKIFNADNFNPFTRYSIDIRDILPKMISKLQKNLSKRTYDTTLSVGNDVEYELYDEYLDILRGYKEKYGRGVIYEPKTKTQFIENINMTIRGVECKVGFYINNNPIVERLFYVDGFNPESRWSVDLLNIFLESATIIEDRIKKTDVKNIWDDYDIINVLHIGFNQIREFSPEMRQRCLDKIARIKKN